MKTELYQYSVLPRIVPLNREVELAVHPVQTQFRFLPEITYTVQVCSLTRRLHGKFSPKNNIHTGTVRDGVLYFSHTFLREEECYLRIFRQDEENRIVQLSVYALEDDLFALRPLKGDFHVHTCRSDGKETPAMVAANYRYAGFDFVPITDHRQYAPSIEAQEAYQDVPLGLLIVNGEEVHTPENYVHVINFGAASSVNALYEDESDTYRKEVQAILDTEEIPYEDQFVYAANLWAARKIRERGGLAMFCHPHWLENVHNVPDDLVRLFVLGDEFDAFELIGGQITHENNMQIALYNDLRTQGRVLAPIGASDSHGTINSPLFNKMYTIVFAQDNTTQAIIDAVRAYRCAPVEEYMDSQEYSVHGSYRHVSYARFLLTHYFAPMQKLCEEEGVLMQLHLQGDKEATSRLAQLQNRTTEFYRTMFAREN